MCIITHRAPAAWTWSPSLFTVYLEDEGSTFTTRPLIHHLLLLQTSASSSLSAAEAAVQRSVLGAVEEIGDRRSRRQMATLCSLGAVCRYTMPKPLIQHSLGLSAGLLQGQSWHLKLQLTSFLSLPSGFFRCVLLSISPLTADIIVILWYSSCKHLLWWFFCARLWHGLQARLIPIPAAFMCVVFTVHTVCLWFVTVCVRVFQ